MLAWCLSCCIFAPAFLKDIIANVAQLVEHDLAKVGVAGSNLVIRSGKRDGSSLFLFEVITSLFNMLNVRPWWWNW
jgi:hypothetical protein